LADNVTSGAASGGPTFATDEIGAVHFPRVKLVHGADGSATDTSTAAPLPVRPSDGSALQTFAELDLDAGAGTVNRIAVGLALPGSGGAVAGGTNTNPIRIDPTNATPTVVVGPDEHSATVGHAPVVVAGRANGSNDPTPVSDGDVCYQWVDLAGRTVTTPHFPALIANGTSHGPIVATLTASGDTTVIAAPGSESLHITTITAVNTDGANDVLLRFKDGGNTRVITHLLKLDGNNYHIEFSPPWKMTAATALVANLGNTANVYVTVHFFTAA